MNAISISINKQNWLNINGRTVGKLGSIKDTAAYLDGIDQALVTFTFDVGVAPEQKRPALYQTYMRRIQKIANHITATAVVHPAENKIVYQGTEEHVFPNHYVVPVTIER